MPPTGRRMTHPQYLQHIEGVSCYYQAALASAPPAEAATPAAAPSSESAAAPPAKAAPSSESAAPPCKECPSAAEELVAQLPAVPTTAAAERPQKEMVAEPAG